jgi:hypothetical protein
MATTRVVEAGAPIDHAPARLNRTLTIQRPFERRKSIVLPQRRRPSWPGNATAVRAMFPGQEGLFADPHPLRTERSVKCRVGDVNY